MSQEDLKVDNSRREFLKGSLAVGAGSLVVGLSACAPKVVSSVTPEPTAAPVTTSADGSKKYSFETAPDPIPASDIKETKTTDVVILGAGLSGFCAALAAIENGSKVVMLEKRNTFTYHGGWNGVIGDRQHETEQVVLPKDEIQGEIMRFGAYHPNQRLIKVWSDESGRVMNKLLDMADTAGIKYQVAQDIKIGKTYKEYPTAVQFLPAMNGTLLPLLEQNAREKGVEILYETPAVQLLKDAASGKVTGVIGKNANGYVQVDAAKAVIICTGCYGSNKEMQEKYSPRVLKTNNNQYAEGSNTGDGIIMGMWAGAAKQETDCPMLWDGTTPGPGIFVSIARQPWLYVNILGERYANEDAPFGYTANQDIQQPESSKWAVWDANWNTDREKFGGTVCENMHIPTFWTDESYANYMEKGVIIEADTIEALAEKMGVPSDTFVANVKRYNELVEKGVDDDFGKDPKMLTAIVKGPFGAAKVGTAVLVTLDGLRINTDMQVLDTNGAPIAGLYAAGNASGDFFSNDYSINCQGVSHGRALTFGWIAGEKTAKL